MSVSTQSTLSVKRILLTMAILLLVPVFRRVVSMFISIEAIADMFSLNITAWILILYDWNLLGVHYNRAKDHIGEAVLWTVIGTVFLSIWLFVSERFLKAPLPIDHVTEAAAYPGALPPVLIAYSFSQAALINIGFKCMTDHFNVRSQEVLVILLSGFAFGLYYTLLFTPASLHIFIPVYLYNILAIAFSAYLYNQSHSFVPGMAAMTIVYFLYQILILSA